jgi:hypothetical protein
LIGFLERHVEEKKSESNGRDKKKGAKEAWQANAGKRRAVKEGWGGEKSGTWAHSTCTCVYAFDWGRNGCPS